MANIVYKERFAEGREQLQEWLRQGKITSCETLMHGLENTPKALLNLFTGDNIGKQLVKVEYA